MAVLIRADSRYPINRKLVRKTISEALLKQGMGIDTCEVSVAVVGGRKMRELSKSYYDDEDHQILTFCLEDPSSTDAFVSLPDGVLRLGDIILCWPKLVAEAGKEGVMVDSETKLLIEHGVKHLLGNHHD